MGRQVDVGVGINLFGQLQFARGHGFALVDVRRRFGPTQTGQAKEPQRVILNFETPQVQEEFERVKAAGAKVVKEPYELQGMWIATFADPDGNYFQLMSPWEEGTAS